MTDPAWKAQETPILNEGVSDVAGDRIVIRRIGTVTWQGTVEDHSRWLLKLREAGL